MTRLDKIISDCLPCTRKEAGKLIRSKNVTVNGISATKPEMKVEETSEIAVCGKAIRVRKFIYIMLNKPEGLISATDDLREKTVLSLLPDEYMTKGLFPAGRLDKDTTGLLILTNDGVTAHRVLSPKSRCEKVYAAETDIPFDESDPEKVKNGVMLSDGKTCPIKLVISRDNQCHAEVTVTEGRFHEVKRICSSIGKPVVKLERISFCGIRLDENLGRGEWRMLTDEEINTLSFTLSSDKEK